jgi:5-hydroxyisourate hydrolase
MSRITTHILDTSSGRPAASVDVTLYKQAGEGWAVSAEGKTDESGRIGTWSSADAAEGQGTYKLRFETGAYFEQHLLPRFYPFVEVYFEVTGDGHYHIPLLLSPYGYSTYRGS